MTGECKDVAGRCAQSAAGEVKRHGLNLIEG